MGLGMPIPDLSNKPGPGRPGWGPAGSYDFQFEVDGAVTIEAFPNTAGQSFTIKWQDGTTTQSSGSSTISSPAGAGIISINNELDNTYADEFKIVSGQANVTKVISWGQNPWSIVEEAFKDCVNLTDISTTSFIAGTANRSGQASGCIMGKMFLGCTSLLEVDIKTWDLSTNGASWRLGGPFANLANLQKLDATGLKIKFFDANNISTFSFANIGTNVADGCEFKMAGLDLSTSSTGYLDSLFAGTKFKGGSNLSNWKFPVNFSPVGWRGYDWFASCILNDGILDISGWTTWPGATFPRFSSFNSQLTSQGGGKVDLSNFGLTNVNDFNSAFGNCKLKEVIGFSTWGACAGNANMFGMFSGATLMRIDPSDNFSDTFVASLTPVNITKAFQLFGDNLLDSERGVNMNLNNIDFSNVSSFYFTWRFAKLLDAPDFSTAIFDNNNPVTFESAFRSFNALNANSSFVLNGGKITNFLYAFRGATINTVNIDNGVDLSALTSVAGMFYYSGVGTATLPSNADYSSLTNFAIWNTGFNGFSVCQGDILMRRLKATNLNANITANLPKITESPALVNSDRDVLENTRGWNITTPTPDATLPFAYPAYFVDRDVYSNITPSSFPAGSTFSSTNAGMTINQNTGVISWASNFSGESVIRCTYPDGCYNEVNMLVGVPMVYKVTVGDSNYGNGDLGFQVQSIGDYRTQSVAIDLGDGTTAVGVNGINHTYAAAGDYNISIFGNFDPWFYNLSNDANKLREVSKWGESNHSLGGQYNSSGFSQRGAFNGCNNMDITATDACIFLPGRSLLYAFVYCYNLTNSNGSMNTWDVSEVTDFGVMFYDVYNKQFPVDQWVFGSLADTGGISLSGMFQNTSFNTDISTRVRSDGQIAWDTEGVTSMSSIFRTCTSFKQDISNWNTDNVVSLYGFQYPYGQNAFGMDVDMSTKQVTVGTKTYIAWDVKSCTNFANMFGSNQRHGGAKPRNLINWNTSSATTMSQMFYKARVDPNGPAWNLTPRQVTVGTGATARTYNAWDVSNVENFSGIFNEGVNRSGPNSQVGITRAWIDGIEDWDVSGSTGDFKNAFYKSNIGVIDLSSWNASIEKGYFFSGGSSSFISSFAGLDITNLGTGSQSNWGYWSQNTYTSINASGTTTNYDETLIAWGAQSANIVNTTSLDFGTSQYSPGNVFEGSQSTNTYQGNSIYGGGIDMTIVTSIGDIVERPVDPNGVFDTYAIITGYTGTGNIRATTNGNIGPSSYTVMDSDAAKGRFALINAGWTITDGGAYLPFNPVSMTIDVNAGDTFTIQCQSSSGNNFSVDWGDGNGYSSTPYTGSSATSPAYATGGEKTILITKDSTERIHSLYYRVNTNLAKIKTINDWGTNPWKGLYEAFAVYGSYGTHPNFSINTTSIPNLSNGPSLSRMFRANTVTDFTNSNIENWNVDSITNFEYTFQSCTNFNVDVSNWNVANVTNAGSMFSGCVNFNQDISNWNTSQMTNISGILSGCTSFNYDINTKDTGSRLAWDVSNVTNFSGAFYNLSSYTYDVNKWQIKTSGGVNMQSMFGASTPDLDVSPQTVTVGSGAYQKTYLAWDTQAVTNMSSLFAYATSTTVGNNSDVSKWDTSSVTNLYRAFRYAHLFNRDISTHQVTVGTGSTQRTYNAWDVSSVTNMDRLFERAYAFNQNIGNWNIGLITNGSINHVFQYTGQTAANYTDSLVGWANFVKNQTPDSPLNINLYYQYGRTFDSNMSGGSNFANAWEARSYLTDTVANGGAGWSISGDTVLPLLVPSTSSLEFNGSTEYIDTQVSPRTLVGNSNAYTISAYVFIEEADIAEENYFIIGAMSGTERWYFRVNDGYVGFGYGTIISSTTLTPITAGQWNHVAVTYNGTNTHKIYVDGGSPKYTSTSSTGQTITTNNAYIGALNNGGAPSLHFKGKIDEVMVWNTELAQANIQTLANAVGSGNVTNPEQLSSGLQLWNRMGD